jgi:hypothetical protein
MIGCDFPSNVAIGTASSLAVKQSTIIVFNSTVSENFGFYCGMFELQESIFSFQNCTFRDYKSTGFHSIGLLSQGSSGSFTDCLFLNNRVPGSDGFVAQDTSIVRFERSVWMDNSVEGDCGCLYAFAGASITIDDSDLINCQSEGEGTGGGGTGKADTGGTLTITNSRIVGSSANSKGTVATIGAGGTLRISASTIIDSGGDGEFAIYDESGSDFAVQVRSRQTKTGGEHCFA